MSGDMAADNARDYRVKGLMDEAVRALRAVLDSEDAVSRLGVVPRRSLRESLHWLEQRSGHVVAVWD